MSRTHKGMLQMLSVFLIMVFSIGLPRDLSDMMFYAFVMSLSSYVAVCITMTDTRMRSSAVVILMIWLIGITLTFATDLVGYFLEANCAKTTVASTTTLFLITYLIANYICSISKESSPEK